METASPSFNGPSGAAVNTAKCSSSSDGCLQKASQTCGGHPYQVLDSESHLGGLLTDAFGSVATWYTMTYQCGPSDGKLPTFAFRGPPQSVDQPGAVVVNSAGTSVPASDAPRLSPPITCQSRRVGGMVQTTC
jgi:hypothetical protein